MAVVEIRSKSMLDSASGRTPPTDIELVKINGRVIDVVGNCECLSASLGRLLDDDKSVVVLTPTDALDLTYFADWLEENAERLVEMSKTIRQSVRDIIDECRLVRSA